MTLITARAQANGVFLVSDLRVSWVARAATRPRSPTPRLTDAMLKAVLLNHEVVVAFAGDVKAALSAIRAIHQSGERDPAMVAEALHSVSSETGTQFLIGATDGSLLRRVSDGDEEVLKATWIGDFSAFSAYQERFLATAEAPRNDLDEEAFLRARMHAAMEAVVDDDSVESVGESLINVISSERQLRYVGAVWRADAGLVVAASEPGETRRRLGPQDGTFSYTVLTPRDPGVAAMAIYVYEGRLGLLYQPLIADSAHTFQDVSPEEFLARVRYEHGLMLMGDAAFKNLRA